MALEGHLSLREASDRMEASYRHTQRLKGVVARSGPRKLTHGNTERCSGTAVDGSPAEDPGLIWHRVCSLQLHPFHREAFNRPRDSNQAGDGQKDSRGLALCLGDEDVLLGIGSAGLESLSRG